MERGERQGTAARAPEDAGVPKGGVESPGFSFVVRPAQVCGSCPASRLAETRGVDACFLAQVVPRVRLLGRMPGMLGCWAESLKSC